MAGKAKPPVKLISETTYAVLSCLRHGPASIPTVARMISAETDGRVHLVESSVRRQVANLRKGGYVTLFKYVRWETRQWRNELHRLTRFGEELLLEQDRPQQLRWLNRLREEREGTFEDRLAALGKEVRHSLGVVVVSFDRDRNGRIDFFVKVNNRTFVFPEEEDIEPVLTVLDYNEAGIDSIKPAGEETASS